MQTAIDQFRDNIVWVRNIDSIHSAFSSLTTGAIDLSDLLRTQIVLCVSAFDQYVHEVTRLGMIEILESKRPQTPAFMRFMVSMDSALQAIRAGGSAWLDSEIRTRHSFLAFQQPDRVAEAIRLISAIELWNSVGTTLGMPAAEVKERLRLIVDRRNRIAHEADIDPSFPNTRWPITPSMAQDTVDFIEKVCEAIHSLVA